MNTKLCSRCKIEKPIEEFNKSVIRKDGFNYWCRPCEYTNRNINGDKYKLREKQYYKENRVARDLKRKECAERFPIKNRYDTYIRSAKIRNYIFNLTIEQFTKIVQQPCHYCGSLQENKINGIDRKDNTIGYLIENCLPCCGACNYAKRSRSYDDFVTWVKQCCRHLSTKVQQGIEVPIQP